MKIRGKVQSNSFAASALGCCFFFSCARPSPPFPLLPSNGPAATARLPFTFVPNYRLRVHRHDPHVKNDAAQCAALEKPCHTPTPSPHPIYRRPQTLGHPSRDTNAAAESASSPPSSLPQSGPKILTATPTPPSSRRRRQLRREEPPLHPLRSRRALSPPSPPSIPTSKLSPVPFARRSPSSDPRGAADRGAVTRSARGLRS